MKISEYIELNLYKRPRSENKEWLSKELGVNYKTLCGWFKRNSFDGLTLTKMLDILQIDFKDFSENVIALSKEEILGAVREFFKGKNYNIEGMFVDENKKYYSSVLELKEGIILEFNNEEKIAITLNPNDIHRLLKGYEVSKNIEEKEFIFYIKDNGSYVIENILNECDEIRAGHLQDVVDITKANISEFLYALSINDYMYMAQVEECKQAEILVGDTKEYISKFIWIRRDI